MRTQQADLEYGYERERVNHPRIEKWLGVKLQKLDKYNIMDWREIYEEEQEIPPWIVEQKARKISYAFCEQNYSYNGKPTALIGKHKTDYMKLHGNGIVLFDFTDRLMYWIFDEEEYESFDVEEKFVRGARSDYVDKPADVLHIPLSILKEVPYAPKSG